MESIYYNNRFGIKAFNDAVERGINTGVFGVSVLVYSALFITVSKAIIARRNESIFRVDIML